jgi:hypothetical protein
MKVPEKLARAFGDDFEKQIAEFVQQQGLLPDLASLHSPRYISRSIIPHIVKLSSLFNRVKDGITQDQSSGLDPYWKSGSNPEHLRLAYFLYFMPCNLFRVASVWSELHRLGFSWPAKHVRAVEFGAGPASGLCGIAAGEKYASLGLPSSIDWALIEQDKAVLELGTKWAQRYLEFLGMKDWGIRSFHRKLEPEKRGFLPRTAPSFNLWLMSFYLNELELDSDALADLLLESWQRHLDEEGLVILIEPALKLQSRRLLELRKSIIQKIHQRKIENLQVLLPCLGHQACGALANPEDWCHEEVTWWRPPYFRKIDQMASLDRKTLPFSYLVIMKSKRRREEILPELAGSEASKRFRLVSPAHSEGKDLEFFVCGEEGKKRARFHPKAEQSSEDDPIQRGSILLETKIRGSEHASRIEEIKKKL